MRRTLVIARREFATTVRRASYIIATFGTLMFFIVLGGIATIPSLIAVRRELAEQKFVAVVDESGLLTDAVLATEDIRAEGGGGAVEELMSRVSRRSKGRLIPEIRRWDSRGAAEAALRAEDIKSFYVVPRDYVETGELEYVSRKRRFLWDPAGGGSPLRPWLIEGLLVGEVAKEHRVRARRPVAGVRSLILGPDGRFVEERPEETLSQIVVPFTFAFVLMLSIFIASGYLIQGLAEEKSNRVIEMLLSSATPDELIAGKLLGLGSAGLLQLVVWVTVTIGPAVVFTPIHVAPRVVLLSAAYYVVGFVFFGSIMAGVGCVSGGTLESQHFASLWSVVAVVPILFSPLILEAPNSVFSRVLSYVPFTCPITMIMRVASGEYSVIDVPLTLLVMVVGTLGSLWVSARLFRVGLLLRGQRPSLSELLSRVWAGA